MAKKRCSYKKKVAKSLSKDKREDQEISGGNSVREKLVKTQHKS